ncbi:MAG: 4-alpha-glucanotransferase [Candidatus Cryptobacteroides sp.]
MKVTFQIEYRTKWGESLALVLADKKYPMSWTDGAVWTLTLDKVSVASLKDYGYVLMKDGLIDRIEWTNHSAKPAAGTKELVLRDSWIDCPIPGCPFPRAHQAEKFDRAGFRGAGTAVPVFSLRSESDFGIGEFNDLKDLVDWAVKTGQCIIQILPINDTTRKGEWKDSYPYSPVSSFALHPIYIHLQDLGIKETAAFKKEQQELNALPEIDYPRVYKSKMALVRKAFTARGQKDLESAACRKFIKENAYWLDEYAEFCAKRDGNEPEYHKWIQFHLDKQLSAQVKYARSKGISLKGDLPIGVSQDSADAYYHPELFNLDSSAGAPPDYFSQDGQNWGFPTYNWDEMAKDDYAWWKSRLRKMSQYFDAFRIDHILGFFRIWEIPAEQKSGLMGHFNPALPYSADEIYFMRLPREGLFHEDPRHPGFWQPLIKPDTSRLEWWQKDRFDALYTDFFYHRHDDFWRRNAERKLPELLSASGMLACGEDLGMVPDCVPGVMDHWKILSLEMTQMDKGHGWPTLSVCATSSHDMSTLRMQNAEAGKGDMAPWEVKRILWNHLSSRSMLAIFPLQDWVAIDENLRRKDFMEERVNQPADPLHHWRYRFHLPISELTSEKASELNVQIEGLLKDSGRFEA